mgnify:CR=1 FL=1
MAKKETSFIKKILHRYRLVIVNEETFEERVSFKISRLSVFLLVTLLSFFLIGLTSVLIVYTPLKTYIPGYTSTNFKTEAVKINLKIDSLEQSLEAKSDYLDNLKLILSGEIQSGSISLDSAQTQLTNNVDQSLFETSKSDSILRVDVENEDKYNVLERAILDAEFSFFPPVKGVISESFSIEKKHYAVDIATEQNESVKSVADGRVIFSEFTTETGYVIIIEHQYSLISVYKHNSTLLKSQGDFVSAGEVIALTGNSGEFSTGTHLHFELWSDGNPLNPEEFLNFD